MRHFLHFYNHFLKNPIVSRFAALKTPRKTGKKQLSLNFWVGEEIRISGQNIDP